MADVIINPSEEPLSIKVEVMSMQIVSYSIVILGSDGTAHLSEFYGDSQTENPKIFPLSGPSADYLNCYVCGSFSLIDPVGAGNPFDIEMSILQSQQVLVPVIAIKGTTSTGKITRYGYVKLRPPLTT
jgi:hypothetical protein